MPHRQQMLGAPFKPSFGLSGVIALDVPPPVCHARQRLPGNRFAPSATNAGCPIQAVLWLEWDNRSRTCPLPFATRANGYVAIVLLPHRQQMLGAPFKPSFGLSGVIALERAPSRSPRAPRKLKNSAEGYRIPESQRRGWLTACGKTPVLEGYGLQPVRKWLSIDSALAAELDSLIALPTFFAFFP